jgi:hypothetical protein
VLAKESILVLPMYVCLAGWRTAARCTPAAAVFAVALALTFAVRAGIARDPAFENISGLAPDHFISNLKDLSHWTRQTWHTIGVLLVVAALQWRAQPRELLRIALFLAATLWLSNLFLSHLMEARNLLPAAIPLSIMAATTATACFRQPCDPSNPGGFAEPERSNVTTEQFQKE